MSKQPSKLNPIQSFQLFCLENYRNSTGVSGKKALNVFVKEGVFDFLASGYDLLHTQSKNFIIDEINQFINREKCNK
jgi:hypothetical protein